MAGGRLHLILLAGGRGLRAMDADHVPKQFRPTGRGLLFSVSLREFLTLDPGSGFRPADLILTVPDDWRETAAEALKKLDIPWGLAQAGTTRTGSTWNAIRELEALHSPGAEDLVAVHDAARPFASADLLVRLGRAATEAPGAIPGIPVPDTIVQSVEGTAVYLERSTLLAVQTPQVFRWDLFQAAHDWAAEKGAEFTDDGGLLAARGHDLVVVAGEPGNWKVTTNADWDRAQALLKSP
jgi:2-C-methyl-D-erythritol 4-phosphate cytidylyltransferase/2-C-methyl-D-erythritol 2,4-cyclodiphosphate synthase